MKTFTTKKLSEQLNLTTKELISILMDIEYVKEENKILVSFSRFGENVDKETFSFIIWNESLLEDEKFKKALSSIKKVEEKTEERVEEIKFISATAIASEKGISPSQVNQVLVEIHYLNKLGKGFSSNHAYAKQLMHENIPYVKWDERILSDEIFNREINIIKNVKEEFKKEENLSVENQKEPFKFDRKSFDAALRTQSGHFVRSRAEVIVADWLYNNDVMFAYEKRLPILDEAYSDFFIKKGKVYIEVWGLESSKYLERKAKKIEIYKENGFTLIGLDDKDIENIDDFLPLKLAQVGIMI